MEKRTKSQARKDYWASVPKEERQARARKAAFAKNNGMTAKDKRALALKMVEARRVKKAQSIAS